MWTDPLTWFPWIKVGAFILGMLVGGFAISSTSWVWWKKQLITVTACWLATLGTGLIGMSIWQSIQIEGAGFTAKLGQIEAQIQSTKKELDKNIDQIGIELIGTQLRLNKMLEASFRAPTSPRQARIDALVTSADEEITEIGAMRALTAAGYDTDEARTIVETIMNRGGKESMKLEHMNRGGKDDPAAAASPPER